MQMKIKNINLRSIEARRYAKGMGKPTNIRIDHNSTVTLFTVMNEREAQVEFEYTASYGPVGLIKMEGEFRYEGKDARDVAKTWQDKRNMPNDIASQIHTAIMHFCLPEAVFIARDLRLPPPIPLPQVKFDKRDEKKGYGPEVA